MEETVKERTSAEIMASLDTVHKKATELLDSIVALLGAGAVSNRVAYSRGLAMERLEEVMFRVNEGTQWLLQSTPDVREKMAEMALKQSSGAPGLQVVNGGKA